MIPYDFSGLNEFAGTLAGFARAVGNHLWQSTVFAVVATGLVLALRKNNARARYWIWMAASVKFVVPIALLAGMAGHFARPSVVATAQPPVYFAMEDVSEPFAVPVEAVSAPVAAPVAPVNKALVFAVLGGAVWLGGFAVVLCLWCVRWRRVASEMQKAVPMREGRELETLRRLEGAGGLRSRIELVASPGPTEPGVFGIARPILAWPAGISERLDDAQMEAVLAHEVCHVRRRDNLTAAIHMLVEAVFWFYPLVWWMGARLLEERERACDEEVLELCKQPEVYAESILKVCEFCVESPLACVSGVTGADLKKRIVQIMTERVVHKLGFGRKLLLAAVGMAVVAVPIVLGQVKAAQRMAGLMLAPSSSSLHRFAEAVQSASNQPAVTQALPDAGSALPQDQNAGKPFEFDVVSIRPAKPGNQSRSAWTMRYTDDGLQISNMPLSGMLSSAYQQQLQSVSGRILGLPDWARTEEFDVQAKVADSDIAEWSKLSHSALRPDQERRDLSVLLLLTEQFKLKTHSETKEEQMYALVVAKGGPKLKLSTSDDPQTMRLMSPGHLSFTGTPIGTVVLTCAQMLGRKVVDKTGLAGKYDFTLNWDQGPTAAAAGSEPDVSQPPVFTVVQEQLGLKLVAQKGPVEYIVVDHAEKPESMDGAGVTDPTAAKVLPVTLVQEKSATGTDATASAAYVPTMVFDVASVRENKEADLHSGITMSGQFTPHTTNLRLINWRIESILSDAFGIQEWQAVGAPKWPYPTVFVIEAKGDADADAKMAALPADEQRMEQQHMLQALLADRFKLKTHWETKEGAVYNLVLAKGGPKLGAKGSMPPSAEELKNFGDRPVPPLYQKGDGRGHPEWVGNACQMDALASILTAMFGRPVTDKTGLTGKYDFVLKYKGRWDSDRSADDMDPTPPMDRALQEELGLKVETAKGPVKVLVIDHIEKPSEN